MKESLIKLQKHLQYDHQDIMPEKVAKWHDILTDVGVQAHEYRLRSKHVLDIITLAHEHSIPPRFVRAFLRTYGVNIETYASNSGRTPWMALIKEARDLKEDPVVYGQYLHDMGCFLDLREDNDQDNIFHYIAYQKHDDALFYWRIIEPWLNTSFAHDSLKSISDMLNKERRAMTMGTQHIYEYFHASFHKFILSHHVHDEKTHRTDHPKQIVRKI